MPPPLLLSTATNTQNFTATFMSNNNGGWQMFTASPWKWADYFACGVEKQRSLNQFVIVHVWLYMLQ